MKQVQPLKTYPNEKRICWNCFNVYQNDDQGRNAGGILNSPFCSIGCNLGEWFYASEFEREDRVRRLIYLSLTSSDSSVDEVREAIFSKWERPDATGLSGHLEIDLWWFRAGLVAKGIADLDAKKRVRELEGK